VASLGNARRAKKSPATIIAVDGRGKLIHPQIAAQRVFRSLSTPTFRGSTTLSASAAAVTDDWDQLCVRYGCALYGAPTTVGLAARLSGIEGGGRRCMA
jgi:cysteine-S-conjugate beta-lyase